MADCATPASVSWLKRDKGSMTEFSGSLTKWSKTRSAISRPTSSPEAINAIPSTAAAWCSAFSVSGSAHRCISFCTWSTFPVPA
eukprot:scaffold890_cov269-Pinguiococcus_pyrenoidosus.AAC.1